MYKSSKIIMNQNFATDETGDSMVFTKFRFYISNIKLFKNDNLVFQEKSSVHLMDMEGKMQIKLSEVPPGLDYNIVEFGLGIDSVTNTIGALDGELDPTLGMYWTWQSGYINFKMEGKYFGINMSEKEFVYHLGGYSGNKNSYRTIILHTNNQSKEIVVGIDIFKFMNDKTVVSHNLIMSPGELAVKISELLSNCFIVK